ncbi:NAD-dependent epimerase/dehydratase family protein [Flavobacterium aestuarii]|uniref:NAD-dependent epimerase/dehydratase family protein n=1 Tax=Flavobacterium aestuarii TaxID=3149227 RepID=UPI0032B51EB3
MKILVTGAAGFIGFHLVKDLLVKGINVIGIDNINDYYEVNLKYDRLHELGINRESISEEGKSSNSVSYENFKFAKIDIIDLKSLENLFAQENFTHIVNLAAQAGVRYSLENPHAYIQSNVVGFVNILECSRKYKIEHLVYASSSSVYGMNAKIPFSEDDKVDFPVSLYAATKKSNELMAHTYSHLYQIPTTGLRFFTVYGSYGRPDMSPMLFADAIYTGTAIKVFNGGDMLRDFTYVGDIVKGIVKVIEKAPNQHNTQPYYNLFNIGNSKPIQLMDFIRTMEKSIGIDAKLEMYPMQPGDVKVTYADTSKLELLTSYKPSTELKEGVSKFVEWYKRYKK